MTLMVNIKRNVGHPGDGRKGFDLLFVETNNISDINSIIEKAKLKFWHNWIVGVCEKTKNPCAVMYQPSGIQQEWSDLQLS